MPIASKVKTLVWFMGRPSFYAFMADLIARKLTNAARHEKSRKEAGEWAALRAIPLDDALDSVSLSRSPIPSDVLVEAAQRVEGAGVEMGGAGCLDLVYSAIVSSVAQRVVETGVAYGWSSAVALAALAKTNGQLVSVDMPYVKEGKESFVGVAVPPHLRGRWILIRKPDRNGIKQALSKFGGQIDLCHYDSDKSYAGRMYAYPLLWNALRPGGVFISDDIQDNFAFRDFFGSATVIECQGKYVGLIRK